MNDIYLPCLCGSGKKFKFCCYGIQKKGGVIPATSVSDYDFTGTEEAKSEFLKAHPDLQTIFQKYAIKDYNEACIAIFEERQKAISEIK